jgi:hypothetical protein
MALGDIKDENGSLTVWEIVNDVPLFGDKMIKSLKEVVLNWGAIGFPNEFLELSRDTTFLALKK